jgi:hypothetical protein
VPDTLIAENPRAVIGGNMPPEPTPYEKAETEIGNLYEEAKLYLDGAAVETQGVADDIANLLNMLRAAEKKAEEARKVEKEPHLEAGRAVDAKFKPLLERVKLAADGCKKALAPWLAKLEAEKAAKAEAARREAEEKARAAQEAIRAAQAANLEEREAAEALLKEAKKAEAAAARAEKDTAKAGGSTGRAVSLRTEYRPVLVNEMAARRHYYETRHPELLAFLQSLAEQDVRAGKREIPGFEIVTEQKAV